MEASTQTAAQDIRLDKLRQRFGGELITAADERYGPARQLWNAMVDRRPAVIAQPRNGDDVAAAILHAREQGLEIAVRGGGHSLPGHSMSEGGITIDLSGIDHVRVGESRQRGQRPRAAEPAVLDHRALELALRLLPAATGDQERGVDGTAPSGEWRVVAPAGEVDDRLPPVAGALGVGELLTSHKHIGTPIRSQTVTGRMRSWAA